MERWEPKQLYNEENHQENTRRPGVNGAGSSVSFLKGMEHKSPLMSLWTFYMDSNPAQAMTATATNASKTGAVTRSG